MMYIILRLVYNLQILSPAFALVLAVFYQVVLFSIFYLTYFIYNSANNLPVQKMEYSWQSMPATGSQQAVFFAINITSKYERLGYLLLVFRSWCPDVFSHQSSAYPPRLEASIFFHHLVFFHNCPLVGFEDCFTSFKDQKFSVYNYQGFSPHFFFG